MEKMKVENPLKTVKITLIAVLTKTTAVAKKMRKIRLLKARQVLNFSLMKMVKAIHFLIWAIALKAKLL